MLVNKKNNDPTEITKEARPLWKKAKSEGGNLVQFQKGKSGNPKGRKKRTMTASLDELKKAGYKQATKDDIRSTYELLITLPEAELQALSERDTEPMINRIVARGILSNTLNSGFDIVERILNRAHGNPTQKVEQKSTVELGYTPPEVADDVGYLDSILKSIGVKK